VKNVTHNYDAWHIEQWPERIIFSGQITLIAFSQRPSYTLIVVLIYAVNVATVVAVSGQWLPKLQPKIIAPEGYGAY
jgi:hypothetical protein